MAKEYKPLPIGTEDFKEIIETGYYYVDKTLLIKDLLDNLSKVTLFTRPRRFGKTLNMSMLKYFFEDTGKETLNAENRALFDGLKIMEAGEKYTSQMQQYPVISLTLKSAKQASFEDAYFKLKEEIIDEFIHHRGILGDDKLENSQKEQYRRIMDGKAEPKEYSGALKFLSKCIFQTTGKKSIILIDEYDVPLENSHFRGFYNEMIDFLRSLFESALKTNDHLQFAVITGCLRISKESIFTGLNNLRIVSILNKAYGEYFGFTPQEVEAMAAYYDAEGRMDDIRRWYDGYLFGNSEVYNPWSVINFMVDLRADKKEMPKPYWANTSSNDIVRDLIRQADSVMREELESLIAGGVLRKTLHEDITYEEIKDSQENLWNFLFFTGYLKRVLWEPEIEEKSDEDENLIALAIPNREIRTIYRDHIRKWFHEQIQTRDLSVLYRSLLEGDEETFQKELTKVLKRTISYMDSVEAFYHGFLAGVLSNMAEGYCVKSNRESGKGRYDLCVYHGEDTEQPAAIIELKLAESFREKSMEAAAQAALEQITGKAYDEDLAMEGYKECWHIGVAFFRKQCRVKMEKVEIRLE